MSDLPRDPSTGSGGDPPVDPNPDDPEDPENLDLLDPDNPDDPEPPDPDDPEPPDPEAPPAPPSRSAARIARQQRENSELRERLARLEGQASRPAPQPQFDPQAQQRADAEFYASLENLSPVEAIRAVEARANQRISGAMQMQMLQLRNDADRDRFADSAAQDRNRTRLLSRVEELAGNVLASGNLPNRTMIYRMLLGEELETKAQRVLPQARRQAAARVASQTTRPQGGRGDVARGGRTRDQDAEDEALLKSITIGDL